MSGTEHTKTAELSGIENILADMPVKYSSIIIKNKISFRGVRCFEAD